MTYSFDGRKLVVVGESSGMGRQTATDVVAGGGSVVIVGRNPGPGQRDGADAIGHWQSVGHHRRSGRSRPSHRSSAGALNARHRRRLCADVLAWLFTRAASVAARIDDVGELWRWPLATGPRLLGGGSRTASGWLPRFR